MDVVHERVAGMDISKGDAKVCLRTPGPQPGRYVKSVTTYGSTFHEVIRLREDLEKAGVTLVVMEATGVYWKPFLFPLAETLNVELVNAKQARNIPGRKTDVSDAVWLAELAAHGLLRASFIPPERVQQLRDLTRTHANLQHEVTREYSRLEKELEDAGIKLGMVASTLTTQSALRILGALADGERDPDVLAGLAHSSMHKKIPALVEALHGRFNEHHAFMVRLHLDRIEQLIAMITRVDQRTEEVTAPLAFYRDLLLDIPGISTIVANTVIAEIGVDMDVFPSPGQLASWAGVCPGQNESAGRVKSSHTRPGNHYLKAALGTAALSVSRSKTTYLATKYHRIRSHAGSMKAVVAIENTLLVIIWSMLKNGEAYTELGPDYYDKRRPEHIKNRAIRQLQNIGYTVVLQPVTG